MAERGFPLGPQPPGWLPAHNFVKSSKTEQVWRWVSPDQVERGDWQECDCGSLPGLGTHYLPNPPRAGD
jgi:hypothetical protein